MNTGLQGRRCMALFGLHWYCSHLHPSPDERELHVFPKLRFGPAPTVPRHRQDLTTTRAGPSPGFRSREVQKPKGGSHF